MYGTPRTYIHTHTKIHTHISIHANITPSFTYILYTVTTEMRRGLGHSNIHTYNMQRCIHTYINTCKQNPLFPTQVITGMGVRTGTPRTYIHTYMHNKKKAHTSLFHIRPLHSYHWEEGEDWDTSDIHTKIHTYIHTDIYIHTYIHIYMHNKKSTHIPLSYISPT